MQFLYHQEAGKDSIKITGEEFKYLIKVRRFDLNRVISLRNLIDKKIYSYKIIQINKKDAILKLIDAKISDNNPSKKIHILWCIIEPKVIYHTLPMLNQIGVEKISFIYCQRSQKNFMIDLDRATKILINSSQQCGRASIIKLEILDSLQQALSLYPDISVMDFGGERDWKDITSALIGCEGGFSDEERILLKHHNKIGLKIQNILKSETAILSFAIKSLT